MAEPDPAGVAGLLRRAARDRPQRTALVAGRYRPAWAELDERVSRTAGGLLAAGARPGDRVAVQVATAADFVPLYLGALRAGLIAVPVNPAYPVAELRDVLVDSGATLLVSTTVAAIVAAAELPVREVLVAAPQAPEGMRTVADVIATGQPAADAERTGEDTAVLLYTSGTSGRPRGAMLSARALLANLAQLAAVTPPLLRADDVAYTSVPLCHVFGLNAGLGFALHAGATLVTSDRFDPGESLELMAREQVTVVLGVPTMYAAWVDHPQFATGFASVRLALSGSAPLPPRLVAAYGRVGVPLYEGYGLTETAPVVAVTAGPKPGSVGRPLPGVEVQLRDVDGDPLTEDGDPGELCVRGRNLFSGYWPDGTGGPGPDGWWGTGDLAVRDTEGDLRIVGRITDLVLVNGFNVYPAEVEAVLRRLPGVAEAAVVGVPDAATGEAVHAYVRPEPGAALHPDRLLARAAESLATFKLPRRIEIVDRLPHTLTGKVMKWRLTGSEDAHAAR